jgi:glyoxylase-like metal-dependent hydrolase (beta-lactamase superfamily II)
MVRYASVWLAAALSAALASGCSDPQSSPVQEAAAAMGTNQVRSLRYEGSGILGGFRQAPEPGGPWPRHELRNYAVSLDYAEPSMRIEQVWAQGEHPPRGGSGQPIRGERSSVTVVSGGAAWTEDATGTPTPTPGAARERLRALWLTPHGVVKAALVGGAEESGHGFTLTVEGQTVEVTLDEQSRVAGIHYVVDDPFLGDMPVDLLYSDYRDPGGVVFPGRIVESWDGFPVLDVTIDAVTPDAAVPAPVPAEVASAPLAPPVEEKVEATEIAEGVWYLSGSNPRSVAVEFDDHVVVIDGPSGDARSTAVQAWVRDTLRKPIRVLVNTHHHFDHAGGLRGYVAEGIPILTHEANVAFYRSVFARPHTIAPDRLALAPREAVLLPMTEKEVLSDGNRVLELHHIQSHGHAPGYLMAYLPAEHVLIYADSYNPPAGSDPRDLGRTNEYLQGLYDNITRLGLEPRLLAPLHGRPIPYENLVAALEG